MTDPTGKPYYKKYPEKNPEFRKVRDSLSNKLRLKILKRDSFRCVYCGNSPAINYGVVLQIDHIIPISKGGGNTEENLQTLCRQCNHGKSVDMPEESTYGGDNISIIRIKFKLLTIIKIIKSLFHLTNRT